MKPQQLKLKQGYKYNPLSRHRNILCPCGSSIKAKKCHGKLVAIDSNLADLFATYIELLKNETRLNKD